MSIRLQNIKKHFSIFSHQPNLVYLDSAATSQTPDTVIEAMTEYYEYYRSNTHRGLYAISEQATEKFEQVREKTAQFLGSDTEEIIFTRNATHGLNILAHGLLQNLAPGSEVVITEMEHHSNLVPWQQLAKRYQLVLKYIPVTAEGKLDLSALDTIITTKTKVVSCTHASNILGTITPLDQICARAHQVGALVVLDACQSMPHHRINVKDLAVDFLVFSAHKMCGPTGVGVIYGKQALLDQLPPLEFGGHMISNVTFTDTTFASSPDRFEAGTANIAGVLGFGAALDFLEQLDWSAVEAHERQLTTYALAQLQTIPGITIHGTLNSAERESLISFNLDQIHAHDIAHILGLNNIAVRAGHHCAQPLLHKLNIKSSVRASFYFYNTEADIDALIQGLHKAKSIFSQ